jgi:hypothetical protein
MNWKGAKEALLLVGFHDIMAMLRAPRRSPRETSKMVERVVLVPEAAGEAPGRAFRFTIHSLRAGMPPACCEPSVRP